MSESKKEAKSLAWEYERVDYENRESLLREIARLRLQLNHAEEELRKEKDPEEVRPDGERVRKSRWEAGMRNIAAILKVPRGSFEIADLVEKVRELVGDREQG